MQQRLNVAIADGIADVRLTRPEQLNALDEAMFHALVETGKSLQSNKNLRAVVLSGEGRAFCAGLDMASFQAMIDGDATAGNSSSLVDTPRDASGANLVQQAVLVWRDIPVPVLAAIHGVAFGGGLQLALAADLRFVAADTRLSVMEMQWGLIPDMAGMLLLRPLLRDDHFRDLVYSGRIVSGTEAVQLGLASRVAADPHAEAIACAREISAKNPDAVRAAKRLLNLPAATAPAEVLRAEASEQQALLGAPNQVEAVRARLQQRPPDFRN